MIKRIVSVILVLLMTMTFPAMADAEEYEQVSVTVDGKDLVLDVPGIIVNGRTLVPMRAIFEAIGTDVQWDGALQKVSATKGDITLELVIGSDKASVNGVINTLDVPAMLINGRTLVPLRFVGESMKLSVEWDEQRRCARVWTISQEMLDAFKKFDEAYDKTILDWLASLYDPVEGGFYYSVSARDNESFAPDIESTSQAIDILQSSGILPKGVLDSNSIPDEIRLKLLEFFQSRQAEDDGYFYDPQFGKNVGNSKRERNLGQARSQIAKMGGKPLYLLPAERLAQEEAPAAESETKQSSSLPDYLKSEEAFMAHIKSLPWESDPYTAGNQVAATHTTAKELGYEKALIDFIKSIQNTETGLWGEGVGLMNTNAAMKLSGLFNTGTEPYPYVDKMIESSIKVIKESTPKTITDVWNPLVLIWRARQSYPEFPENLKKEIEGSLIEVMELTAERVAKFRKEDNGYSYNLGGSSPISQGATVSLGLPEGDINATCIGVTEMRSSMCACLGITKTPLWDIYAEDFWDKLLNAKPIEKKKFNPVAYEQDFSEIPLKTELIEGGWKLRKYSGDGYAKVTKDPYNKNNHVMELFTNGSSSINIEHTFANANRKIIATEFDIMVDEEASQPRFFMTIGATTACLVLRGSGSEISLGFRTSESGYGTNFKNGLKKGEWYNVRVVYTPGTAETVNTKYYVNDELCLETNKYYDYGDTSRQPVKNVSMITWYTFSDNIGSLYVDNIKVMTDDTLDTLEIPEGQ